MNPKSNLRVAAEVTLLSSIPDTCSYTEVGFTNSESEHYPLNLLHFRVSRSERKFGRCLGLSLW